MYLFSGFELSEEEFSLSRDGKRIPLEPRALRVLLVLVGSQGKLLDKKALLDAVWKDTFVEETTLTRAIALIRKQLEDDPRAPRFIETVPTRGYRFIAPVEIRSTSRLETQPETQSPLASVKERTSEIVADTPVSLESSLPFIERRTQPVERRTQAARKSARDIRQAWLYGSIAACAAVGALAGFLVHRSHAREALNTRDVLVLGDFTNSSGDPVFDDAMRQGMLVQLEQSPVLHLAGDGQIRKTLKLMGLQNDSVVTPEIGREICQRIGGTVVLDGSVSRLGSEYVIGLRARRCSTGEQLDAEQVQIHRKEDALNALGGIATQFRHRVGEASASIQETDTPLAEATTPSLDALKAFSQGIRSFNAQGSAAGAPLFQRAVEFDPEFAAAHVWLGRMYADLGQEMLSIQSTERAHTLRERASDRERFLIDVSYDVLVTGNLEKARTACDAWVQMYPRDVYARAFRAGVIYPAYGQHERAYQEAKESIAIDPDFVLGYRNAALNLISLNRPDAAEHILQQAAQRKAYLPSFVTDSYRIAFLRSDQSGMKKALDAGPRNPWLQYYQAATLARAGQLAQARALQDQALRISQHGNRHEIQAELQMGAAFTEVLYGNATQALAGAHAALQLSQNRGVVASAALVLAMAGSTDEASSLAADLRKRYPEDTLLHYDYLAAVDASIALAHKQPQRALDVLEETSQFELSVPLYPVYLRGEAYLALGRAPEAAAEFRKIVDHPGLVMNDPLYNLALLNLGRAYRRAGEHDRARTVFKDMQHRWESAETSFPVLQQVKQESSEL